VFELAGEHDLSTTSKVEAAVRTASEGQSRIVYDLTGVTYLDSTVLTMLVRSHKQLGKGFGVVLPSASPIRRIFEITKLDRIFPVQETLEEALRAK